MPTHTKLNAVQTVGQSLLSDQLEANALSFFQFALLEAGGFFNVTVPTSGCYGGDQHRLRLVSEPGFTSGRVWETFRKDWVWESGLDYGQQPIRVSGVYVDGNFKPASGVGPYKHHYDYPNGRVVFDTAISPSAVVTAEYSYRLFQLYTADNDWWQNVQERSFRVDDSHFLQKGSGVWDVLAKNRVQLPAMIIEAVGNTKREGYEIGSRTHTVRQDVLFHILAENRWDYKFLHDAVTYQQDRTIFSFDKNELFSSDSFPLDANGSPKPSGMMYPELVSDLSDTFWKRIVFKKTVSVDQPKIGNIRYCLARVTFETQV